MRYFFLVFGLLLLAGGIAAAVIGFTSYAETSPYLIETKYEYSTAFRAGGIGAAVIGLIIVALASVRIARR